MATSPLPDVPNIEAELEKMKLSDSLTDEVKEEIPLNGYSETAIKNVHNNDQLVLNTSSHLNESDCDKIANIPSMDADIKDVSETNKTEQSVPKTEEDNVVLSPDNTYTVHTDSSDEIKTKRKRRKRVAMKKRSKTKDNSAISSKPMTISRPLDPVTKIEELNDKPEEIFQMDDDYADDVADDEGFASTGCLNRSVSLPVAANLDDLFGSEWSQRKTSSTFTGEFHPFSDGDVTPHSR